MGHIRPNRVKRLVAVLITAIGITGCAGSMKPEDFDGKEPRFVIENYFAGRTKAWGIFEDRFGNLRREFVVDIDGRWDGKQLILDERFVYSDGEKEQRLWTIDKIDEHTYSGAAGGVVGKAQGKSYGNVLNWRYDFDLKVDGDTWRVKFNDWMFLQPDGVMLNKAEVSKWGIHIGTVTLAFRQIDREKQTAAATEFSGALGIAAE